MNGYPSSRRTFVKIAGATALAAAVPIRRTWAQTNPSPLVELPSLDGELLLDESGRGGAASDLGGHVRRMPVAVLRPKSANDVVHMVTYANKHGLRIAMRRRGHSQYGNPRSREGSLSIRAR
jgi:cytokinin dehydrogenase